VLAKEGREFGGTKDGMTVGREDLRVLTGERGGGGKEGEKHKQQRWVAHLAAKGHECSRPFRSVIQP